jgi:hypothetical protein
MGLGDNYLAWQGAECNRAIFKFKGLYKPAQFGGNSEDIIRINNLNELYFFLRNRTVNFALRGYGFSCVEPRGVRRFQDFGKIIASLVDVVNLIKRR